MSREDEGKVGSSRVLVRVGAAVGQGTNNEAEYHALLALMRHALKLGIWSLDVRSDSLLVVNQMADKWKVRGRLARLHREAQNLRRLFARFMLTHRFREENAEADALSHTLTFEEPSLPPIPVSPTSRRTKTLQDWQAAAIRVWSLSDHPGAGTLSRIFGIPTSQVDQIAHGKSYRYADFSSYPPPYLHDSTPIEATTPQTA